MAGVGDLELMVMGCLTIGPLEGDKLMEMLSGQTIAEVSQAVATLRKQERVVLLDSGRFALVFRT